MSAAAQTWESPYTVNTRWAIRLLPSLIDFAFILPAFLLFAFLSGTKRLLMDGGTGWHIRTGEWILQHRAVPTTDLFSFTKPHDPWFAWEWGWEVCVAALHRYWGLAGVAFVNVCLLCAISALLFLLIRRACGNDALSLLFTGIAMIASTVHWLARPHLVSWVLLLLFLHALVSAERGRANMLYWLPLLTVLWTNLHGGFFLGPVVVLTGAVGTVLSGVAHQQSWSRACAKAKPYLLTAAACSVATLLNPYSWRLPAHVFSYLRDTKLLDHVLEYRSVNFHEPGAPLFECMLLLGIASVWWCFERTMFTRALLTLLFVHLALLSVRNVPLFLFAASPWVACMVRNLVGRLKCVPFRNFATAIAEISRDLRTFERIKRCHVASLLAVLFLGARFAAGGPGFESQFDPKQFPIEAVPGLASLSKSRVFTYDQWSDYMIYRFYPGTRVFMDDRSDFYRSEFLDRYVNIINAGYRWESDLKWFAIDAVIVGPEAPLATVLKQSPNWKLLFDNGRALVFAASATMPGRAAGCSPAQLSPVSHDGGNESEALRKSVRDSYSAFINNERRSL